MSAQRDLLGAMLGVAVPLRIAEMRASGRPNDADRAWCHEFCEVLCSQGDALLYRVQASARQIGTAGMFNRLARAVAIMAFYPGGITIAGMHFQAAEVVQ